MFDPDYCDQTLPGLHQGQEGHLMSGGGESGRFHYVGKNLDAVYRQKRFSSVA
jgi:hypothetical protein